MVTLPDKAQAGLPWQVWRTNAGGPGLCLLGDRGDRGDRDLAAWLCGQPGRRGTDNDLSGYEALTSFVCRSSPRMIHISDYLPTSISEQGLILVHCGMMLQ